MATRFENGIVVTLGVNNRVLWNATVVTEGEKIFGVGDSAELKHRFPAAEAADCSGKIILPGFICTHHHFYTTMARGMSIPGEPAGNFVEILERLWWKVGRALDEEDIVLSAQVPLIECIRNGTTTIIDHHASPSMRDGSLDLIESAVRQAGLHQKGTPAAARGADKRRRKTKSLACLIPQMYTDLMRPIDQPPIQLAASSSQNTPHNC